MSRDQTHWEAGPHPTLGKPLLTHRRRRRGRALQGVFREFSVGWAGGWAVIRSVNPGQPVRVGVVGLGTIAQAQHLPSLLALPDLFRITAVADLSPKLLRVLADRLPGTVFASTDWKEVCRHSEVDAVLLLTPGAHQRESEGALLAGKHVFSEKPLALTVAGAKGLSALAAERDRVLQVGYMKLYEEHFGALMDHWNTLGEHRLIRHSVYHPSHASQFGHLNVLSFDDADQTALEEHESYELDRAAEAIGSLPSEWIRLYRKFLAGSMIHTAAILRTTMGVLPPITEARLWPPPSAESPLTPPSLSLRARTSDQCRAEMTWLWLPAYPQYQERLEVHGTKGSLEMSFPSPYLREHAATLVSRSGSNGRSYPNNMESAFLRQLCAFHSSITTGNRPSDAWRSAADLAWLQTALANLAAKSGVAVGGEALYYSKPARYPLLHSPEAATP